MGRRSITFLSCLSGSEEVRILPGAPYQFLSCLSGSEVEHSADMYLIFKEPSTTRPRTPKNLGLMQVVDSKGAIQVVEKEGQNHGTVEPWPRP